MKLPRTLMIGTPAYLSRTHVEYTRSLLETQMWLQDHGCALECVWLTECARITKARNDLVQKFMQSDHEHLLMIDSDIGWPADAPARLMSHGKAFVGAVTVKRGSGQMCLRNIDSSTQFDYDPTARLLRVGAIGSAFIMIRRDMIEAMERAYPNLRLSGEKGGHPTYGLFTEMITPAGSNEGEDYSYSERARAIGIEIFVDPYIELSHSWSQSYRGSLADDMKLQRAAPQAQALTAAE